MRHSATACHVSPEERGERGREHTGPTAESYHPPPSLPSDRHPLVKVFVRSSHLVPAWAPHFISSAFVSVPSTTLFRNTQLRRELIDSCGHSGWTELSRRRAALPAQLADMAAVARLCKARLYRPLLTWRCCGGSGWLSGGGGGGWAALADRRSAGRPGLGASVPPMRLVRSRVFSTGSQTTARPR